MALATRHHTFRAPAIQPFPALISGRPSLADDCAMFPMAALSYEDPDLEDCTWPDMIDQRRIGAHAFGRFAHDDAEMDDGI